MAKYWIASGAMCCALAVLAGAFGAHGLKARLDAESLALWETAARYFMYAALGQVAIGLTALAAGGRGLAMSPGLTGAAVCVLAGSLVFSGTVAAIALGGPRWLGAITPLGGLSMIVGFVLFAVAALKL